MEEEGVAFDTLIASESRAPCSMDMEAFRLIKSPPKLSNPSAWVVCVWKACKQEAKHGRKELEIDFEYPGDPSDSLQPVEFTNWLEDALELRKKHEDRLYDSINDVIDELRIDYLEYHLMEIFRELIPTAKVYRYRCILIISWRSRKTTDEDLISWGVKRTDDLKRHRTK